MAPRAAARPHLRRAPGGQAHPRRALGAAAPGSDGGFLVQSLQRGRPQGRREVDDRRLRAHGHQAARAGQVPGLLLATAQHPAMLFYLDNWMVHQGRPGRARRPQRGRQMGLNENYAREIMELHTWGGRRLYPEGRYRRGARLHGWSIDRPREHGTSVFRLPAHDQGEKRILGHVSRPGWRGGRCARHQILARHPSTARFIATKLARRFVSDDRRPPSWSARPRPFVTPTATFAR